MLTLRKAKAGNIVAYLERDDALRTQQSFATYGGAEATTSSIEEFQLKTEELSFWCGAGAEALGLAGPVDPAHAARLERSLHPQTEEPLLENSLRGRDKRGYTPGGGLLFVFSAPADEKVIAHAFPEFRRRIVLDFIAATKATIEHAEKQGFVQSRLGKGGENIVPGGGVWANWVHFTSRNGQIFVHVHSMLMHAVHTERGFRALHNPELFKAQRSLGDHFDAIRARQFAALGFKILPAERGFRIAGIPDEVRRQMSKGRVEIEKELDQEMKGTRHARAAEVAAYAVREEKEVRPLADIFERHEEENSKLSWSKSALRAAILDPTHGHEHRTERSLSVKDLEDELTPEILESLAASRSETADFDLYPEGALLLPPLHEVEAAAIRSAIPRVHINLDRVYNVAAGLWARIVTDAALSIDPYRMRFGNDAVISARVRDHIDALRDQFSRGLSEGAIRTGEKKLGPDSHNPLQTLLGPGGRLRLFDTRDPSERRSVLEALGTSLQSAGYRVIGITLSTKDKNALAKELAGAFPLFTAAKAEREWHAARWRPGKKIGAGKFQKPKTDALQDWCATIFGIISNDERRFNAWQRGRAPLDIARGKNAIIIENAQHFSERRLHGILKEARRHDALVFACGNAGYGERWFKQLAIENAKAARAEAIRRELEQSFHEQTIKPEMLNAYAR